MYIAYSLRVVLVELGDYILEDGAGHEWFDSGKL